MPLVYLLGLGHHITSAIANGAFGAVAIIVLLIVFADKYFSVPHFLRAKSGAKVQDEASCHTVQIFSQDMIRSMKPDEQFEYYTKVILKYSALRLQLNSGDSSLASGTSDAELPCQGQAQGGKYHPEEDFPDRPLSPNTADQVLPL
jgi:hypothetical protein